MIEGEGDALLTVSYVNSVLYHIFDSCTSTCIVPAVRIRDIFLGTNSTVIPAVLCSFRRFIIILILNLMRSTFVSCYFLQLRQLCDIEAAAEEWMFVSNVAREHHGGKAFISKHVPASQCPLAEVNHWKRVASRLEMLAAAVRVVIACPVNLVASSSVHHDVECSVAVRLICWFYFFELRLSVLLKHTVVCTFAV